MEWQTYSKKYQEEKLLVRLKWMLNGNVKSKASAVSWHQTGSYGYCLTFIASYIAVKRCSLLSIPLLSRRTEKASLHSAESRSYWTAVPQ